MPSIYSLERDKKLMTEEEKQELAELGWQKEIVEALHKRGFRPCKPDFVTARFEGGDWKHVMGFLRQTSMPHLYISVERDELVDVVLERIDTALYESGRRAGHEFLAGYFMSFWEQCKAWKPINFSAIEQRLKALEESQAKTTS